MLPIVVEGADRHPWLRARTGYVGLSGRSRLLGRLGRDETGRVVSLISVEVPLAPSRREAKLLLSLIRNNLITLYLGEA